MNYANTKVHTVIVSMAEAMDDAVNGSSGEHRSFGLHGNMKQVYMKLDRNMLLCIRSRDTIDGIQVVCTLLHTCT